MSDLEYEHSRLVTVETFSSPWEAQLARACLEAEGIHAVVADEHFFRLYGALSNALGGVRLQVRPERRRARRRAAAQPPAHPLSGDGRRGRRTPCRRAGEEPEALVTVGRFPTPWEAHLARTLLESEGIDACVLEERLPPSASSPAPPRA